MVKKYRIYELKCLDYSDIKISEETGFSIDEIRSYLSHAHFKDLNIKIESKRASVFEDYRTRIERLQKLLLEQYSDEIVKEINFLTVKLAKLSRGKNKKAAVYTNYKFNI